MWQLVLSRLHLPTFMTVTPLVFRKIFSFLSILAILEIQSKDVNVNVQRYYTVKTIDISLFL